MQKSLDVLIAEDFNELDLAKIITTDYKRYWINKTGQVVSEPKAYVIGRSRSFGSNFKFKTEGETSEAEYSLVNNKDETIVPYGVYDNYEFYLFSTLQGTAFKVEKCDQLGLINDRGEDIFPFGSVDLVDQSFLVDLPEGYILTYEFGQNTFVVLQGDIAGIIDDKCQQLFPTKEKFNPKKFLTISEVLMQYAVPKPQKEIPNLIPQKNTDERWGYVNKKNELIIPYKFYCADEFSNGFAVVSDSENCVELTNGKWYRDEDTKFTCGKQYHIDETGNRLNYIIKYDKDGEIDPS